MERFRIAVIDDEPIIGREIKRGLSKEPHYEVETFLDGELSERGSGFLSATTSSRRTAGGWRSTADLARALAFRSFCRWPVT